MSAAMPDASSVPDLIEQSHPTCGPLPAPPDVRAHRPRRVLLLTSTLGSGHHAAARAVECALLERMPGVSVQTVDFWSLMDWRVAAAIRHAYLRLVQEDTGLYDSVYRIDQHVWRQILQGDQPPPETLLQMAARLTVYITEGIREPDLVHDRQQHLSDRLLFRHTCAALARYASGTNGRRGMLGLALAKWCWNRLARRLHVRVRTFAPDAIVSTMMWTVALLASGGTGRRCAAPVVAVPTDFGVHDLWIQRGVDAFCVAHEQVANVARLPSAGVRVTGIPLMPPFRDLPTMQHARDALGLTAARPVLLVCGGSLGIGVDGIVARLLAAPPDFTILAVTGQNTAAAAALAPLMARYPGRLQTWNWTDRMALLLRAADIVAGKLGGLTVAEALACGRPLVATRSLGGQEGFNQRFLEDHDVGWLVRDEDLVARVQSLLADPARLARLQQQAAGLGRADGAARIADLVAGLAARRPVRHAGPVSG